LKDCSQGSALAEDGIGTDGLNDNVVHHLVGHITGSLFSISSTSTSTRDFSATIMSDFAVESRIILAMHAKSKNPKLSIRHLAKQFTIPRTTLQARMTGRPSKAVTHSSQSNLTIADEDVIVQYILQLDYRGFSPLKTDVEDLVNLLLLKRDARCVGKCWNDRFIARRPELYTRFSRP
jgi:hypothetical protein